MIGNTMEGCSVCRCELDVGAACGLSCANGHAFSFQEGTCVPGFDRDGANESHENRAARFGKEVFGI